MGNVYLKVLEQLKEYSSEKYKAFNEKIANSSKPLLGVTTPKMREVAKNIFKVGYLEYLDCCKFEYFEDTMIYGFVIAKLPYNEFLKYLPIYLSNVDSWAHIDSFVSSLKFVKSNYSDFLNLILTSVQFAKDFTLRFYIVCLMNFYLQEDLLDKLFSILEQVNGKGYYNDMAIAWLISVAFVKFKDKTFDFIKNCKLSSFTLNKSISKIRDSFRVSREDKILLQNYIRKN